MIRERAGHIFRSAAVKNIGSLLSANILAQVIGLLVYPVLSRIYPAEAFGQLSLFLNISNILVLLSTLEYQYAILLSDNGRKARSAVVLSCLCVAVCVAVLMLMLPFRELIAGVFNMREGGLFFYLIPVYVSAIALWNILNMCLTRRKQFGGISGYKITSNVLVSGGKLGFGYAGLTSVGLLLSSVAGAVLALGASLLRHGRGYWRRILSVQRQDIVEVAREYRNFPVYSLPRALVNSLGVALPSLVLAPAFGLEELGYFAMAVTLAFMPISLVTGAVQQVLFQQVTERVQQGQPIYRRLLRMTLWSVVVVGAFFAVLNMVLPWLTTLVLGEGWELTAKYISWLLPWLLMVCLNSPICFVADVFMQQKKGLVYELLILLLRLAGMLIGIKIGRMDVAVIGFSAGSVVALIIQLTWYYRMIRQYERGRAS